MPLVWAHAEYLKLAASRGLKRPFDRPESVWERYRGERPLLTQVLWTEQAPVTQLPEGCALTLALREPGTVHWGLDGWHEARDQDTRPNSLGLHLLHVDTPLLRAGRSFDFTFRNGANWVGRDFHIRVTARPRPAG
jgi:glucoamylase